MKALKTSCRPSEYLAIEDSYTAFCFDEACAFILTKLESGERPILTQEETEKVYKSPSELYKKYNR